MSHQTDPDAAANLIRQKLAGLYVDEPVAADELRESKQVSNRSKHQQYMYDLSNSGKSLAEIQTAWHKYYQDLPDNEKHQVWQEFYREYDKQKASNSAVAKTPEVKSGNPIYHSIAKPKAVHYDHEPVARQTVATLRKQIVKHVVKKAKVPPKEHLKSLGFGLMCGFIALIVFLFGFFNERFIAPFITPSRSVSNAPIIIDSATAPAGADPIIIIPKINVQIPVIYTEPSIDEHAVQSALENGVLHYANTPSPGEKGNGVIFGHSSNNIFNKGKYKFAFVLLKRLEPGDTFTLQKDSRRYVYKVYERKIVSPNDLSVLGSQPSKIATMTLITCDPPGTSINRMIVFGEQISPDPANNKASSATGDKTVPTILPSNAPSLWSHLFDWLSR